MSVASKLGRWWPRMDPCYHIPESEVKEYVKKGPCLDMQRTLSAVQRFLTVLKAHEVDLLLPCGKTEKNAVSYCWIASKLLVLNAVLEGVLLELREDVPGALSLVTLDARGVVEHPDAAVSDAAFLVSWLLCHHCCVRTVHLDNSSLRCQFAPTVVGRALQRSSGIVDLKLSLRSSLQRTQALAVLVSALQHMVSLETLDLGGLVLDRSTVESVVAVLNSTRLRTLVLGNSPQVKKVALKLSRALRKCTCLTSLVINDRVRALPEAALLLEKNTTLQRVSLSGVTGELVGEILLCLARNNTLEELCLSDAALGDYPVPIAPIYAFAASNRRLRVLKLTRLELGDAAATAFAELLRDNKTLEEIDFSGSGVSDFGGNALAEALEVNRSLKTICLEESQLCEDTVEKFARALSQNKNLEQVRLGIVALPEDWRLSDDACDFPAVCKRLEVTWNTWCLERIASCLRTLNTEQPMSAERAFLRLCWTRRTTINGVRAILGAASCVTFLNELTIGSIHVDERGFAETIAALLVSTKTLKKIEISEAINASHVVRVILRAFERNTTVCTARLACSLGSPSTANALKRMLNVNRTLHSIAFRSLNVHPKSLARFVSGIQRNNVLTDLSFGYLFDEEGMRQLRDLLWRNRCLLSRAVKYAEQTATDIESVEAFKMLAGRDSLLCALKKATGKTAAECEDIVTKISDKLQKAVQLEVAPLHLSQM
ncbi:uncharacterized protein LOC144136517 [Amblyomma americanum]